MVAIRLPDVLENRIDQLAKVTGRTKSFYVREALENAIDDLEDRYLALYRLEYPSKKQWTLDEVEKELGLDN
jgi:RHH-type rel operon transcriptional repressor/antitoxin RelB